MFDDPEYFGIFSRYTLAPLSELGEDALSPGEIDAIEEIVLLNYRVWLGGPFNRYIIHGADDFFADLKWRGGVFQAEGPLDRANFRIKYRHIKARRNLTLYTGNSSSYTRDEYSRYTKATGRGGKSRVATDASKARKNIRQQVNRDIDRIRTFSPELGEHLKIGFLSDAMCFQPDHDPQWQF